MEIPIEAIEYAIECAYKYDKKIILNPAPADPNISVEALKKVDYLTPNETEVEIMAKTKGFKESCDALLELGINNLIVTLGDKGAAIINKETNEIVEGFKVEAIDTVGAGDCFNGAFVTALSKGKMKQKQLNLRTRLHQLRSQEKVPKKQYRPLKKWKICSVNQGIIDILILNRLNYNNINKVIESY